jgi:hypothetical protein
MKYSVSHGFKEETLAAKAKWFQQKPIEERLLSAFTWLDFVRLIAPKKDLYEDAHRTFRTFRILKPRKY